MCCQTAVLLWKDIAVLPLKVVNNKDFLSELGLKHILQWRLWRREISS